MHVVTQNTLIFMTSTVGNEPNKSVIISF